MKEEYYAASEEYEGKLRKQAEEFLNQSKSYKVQMDECEKLLSEYDAYICELKNKLNKSKKEYNNLEVVKQQYQALCDLKK